MGMGLKRFAMVIIVSLRCPLGQVAAWGEGARGRGGEDAFAKQRQPPCCEKDRAGNESKLYKRYTTRLLTPSKVKSTQAPCTCGLH